MAENVIEIEVELKGQKDTLKGIDKVKEGAEGIGETFKGVGDLVGKTNQQMGESLGAVSDAVGSSVTAFSEMGSAIKSVSAGGAGITALLGPLGLLTTAIAAGVEAFRQLSGAAKEAENRQAAFAAAAGDLTSKLEALAEKGFVPARRELLAYSRANIQAQIQKELLNAEIEKISKTLQAEADAQAQATKAQQDYNAALQAQYRDARLVFYASSELRQAQNQLKQAQEASAKAFETIGQRVEEVNRRISGSADTYKEFEEQSKEALETKAKELIAQRAALQALEAQVKIEEDAARLTAERNVERQKTADLLRLESMSRNQLSAFVTQQKEAIKSLNEEGLKDAQLAKKIIELNQAKTKARQGETKAIDQQKLAQQALREEQLRLVQESQIRQLDIKLTKEGDEELLALARERYETGLKLAKDDAMKRAIVLKQYQLEVDTIKDQAEAKEFARMERMDAERDAERQRQRDQRQKDADDLVAQQKLMVTSFEEFTKAITKTTTSELQSAVMTLGSVIDEYGKGFAQAAAEAALFGDVAGKSFKEATGELLKSLAVEATVKALMKGAEALAMAFINPALAGNLAASAAAYGAAAAAARAGAGALGVGGGGGGGGTTASPSGAPQVASTPQRATADTQATVVNINFGGAVIYDTQEAARRAMVNDIVRTYNQNPRGMARFNQQRMR